MKLLTVSRGKGSIFTCALIALCSLNGRARQKGNPTPQSIERNKTDNTPKAISLSPEVRESPKQAQELFRKYLDIHNSDVSMVFTHSTTTKSKITTDRYVQYYKGIKVQHGGYTITSKDDVASFMTGNYYNITGNPSTTPVLTEAVAFDKALAVVGAEKYKWELPEEEQHIRSIFHKDTTYKPKATLVWVEDLQNDAADRKLHLAYRFDIYAHKPISRQEIFIDALDGRVLFVNSLIKHTAANSRTLYSGIVPFQTAHIGANYILYDSTRGSGVHTLDMNNGTSYGAATEFTTTTNLWPTALDTQAIDAHWGGEMVYDYWWTQQGRASWDDADGILLQYVHFNTNYNNAYWDGVEMTYGDGTGIAAGGFSPLTSIDVTAHEIGHGVCEATCNLIYQKESGAMNEGFSDCWAATIENWANPHEVDAMSKHPWNIGEEISTEPLRSMNAPLLQGQPNTYGSTNWFNVTGCTPGGGNDQCGVHTNSGLLNYWYYLLTLGGSGTNGIGNSYVINALGWTKASTVLYQTELVLATNATYADCRTASINAATILYGACSPEVQSVTTAWYAVGVGANYVACTPQIGFSASTVHVSEKSTATTCTANKTITVGIKPYGTTITGGAPVVTLMVAPTSTATSGVDYSFSTSTLTFPIGDTSTQYVTVTINDNGAVNDNKHIDLGLAVLPMGSTAVISPVFDSLTIFIDNDDSIPQTGGIKYETLAGGESVVSDFSSPFYGTRRRAHSQYLLYASELQAAGVVPGSPITQIAFNVLTKSSTAAFLNFSVSMRNTTATALGAFVTGLTQVYSGNHTTNLGIDSLNFNVTNFTWDGTSNVVVEFCYGMNAASFTANDKVQGMQQDFNIIGDYNTSNTGTGTGCPLTYSTANTSTARPVMRFKQNVTPTKVATVLGTTRTWNVHAGEEVYFYNPSDTAVIGGIKGVTNNLGCVTATVTTAGTGFTPAVFSPINRSKKEITITPTINGSITSYEGMIYLTNTELASVSPATLFLIKTTAPTDATVSSANSTVLTPTLIAGTNYVGFKGSFTGFSRFFLIDGPLCTSPPATITPAGPTTFCVGSNVLLNANTGTGLTYQWQKDGFNIPGATNASYTATLAGNYTATVYQDMCDSVSLPVTVTLDSAYAAPITGSTSVCTGQNITLSDITPGGTWNSSNPAIASVTSSGVVTGNSPGTATISYSVTNACGTGVATLNITVSTPIAVAAIGGSPFDVCLGSGSSLTNTTPSGIWTSSNTAVATINSSGILSTVSTGTTTISYTVTNAAGCQSAASVVVTVLPLPTATITAGGPTTFCTGGFVILSSSTAAGASYQWSNGSTAIPGATAATYTASTTGTYRVKVTGANGCSATSAVTNVTVNPGGIVTPSVSINASPGTVLCVSASPVSFVAVPVNGGTAPTYQWSVNGTPAGTGSTYSYTPAAGDIVSCMMTSNATCAFPLTATGSVAMTISPMLSPAVTITASPNDTVCTGDLVTLGTIPVNGGSAPTFLWNENGINVATGPYYLYYPTDGDLLIVTMTSNYPCLTTPVAVSPTLTLHVEAPSVNTVIVNASATSAAPGTAVTFTAIAPNGGTAPQFQWFLNATAVAGATDATYTTDSLQAGQIVSCAVTSSLLCAEPKTVLSSGITVNVTTGVADLGGKNIFALQPNPNKGSFVIKGNLGSVADSHIDIAITNMLGETVYTGTGNVKNGLIEEQITLSPALASGVYVVNITSGTGHAVFHMVLDK